MLWTGASYTLQGEEYFFRTIACVESISHSQGDPLGGLEITITGKSFLNDTSRIRVEIDESECEVTSASFSSITCIAGPYYKTTLQSYYEGSAGLFSQRYGHGTKTLQREKYIPKTSLEYDQPASYTIVYGYFKAPRKGEYSFYSSVDNNVIIRLSTDEYPSNKEDISTNPGWSFPLAYFGSESKKVSLFKDQLYYFEIEQINSGGPGQFSLGVKIPGDGNSYRNRMPLVKKISITNPHPSTPIQYKGEKKDIGNLECSGNNYFQKQVASQYFNLYVYCARNDLYVVVPGYMNPHPDDLKFVTNTSTILDGSTLHEP